jgi:hypothetical protein
MNIFITLMFVLTGFSFMFAGGYQNGKSAGENEMRNKVVLYCVEKPDLCKTEYNNIKTQNKLNKYQKPEI